LETSLSSQLFALVPVDNLTRTIKRQNTYKSN